MSRFFNLIGYMDIVSSPKAFLERLKEAFNGKTIKEIGEILGISEQSVYKWGRGKTKPEIITLISISNYTGVSLHWLLKGEGPKWIADFQDAERIRTDAIEDFLIDTLAIVKKKKKGKTEIGITEKEQEGN